MTDLTVLDTYHLEAAASEYVAGGVGPKATLMALVRYMGPHGDEWTCWPGQERLARQTEQTRGTVNRHLAAFKATGLISIRHRSLSEGRGRQTSEYVLNVEALLVGPKRDDATLKPSTKARSEADQSAIQGVTKARSDHSAPYIGSSNEGTTRTLVRPEVARLCDLLADLIEANGCKRPTVTRRWLDACRLLIDADGRTPEQIEHAMRWALADEFWRANILSMPKLREKYEQLRLQAKARQNGRAGSSGAFRELWIEYADKEEAR